MFGALNQSVASMKNMANRQSRSRQGSNIAIVQAEDESIGSELPKKDQFDIVLSQRRARGTGILQVYDDDTDTAVSSLSTEENVIIFSPECEKLNQSGGSLSWCFYTSITEPTIDSQDSQIVQSNMAVNVGAQQKQINQMYCCASAITEELGSNLDDKLTVKQRAISKVNRSTSLFDTLSEGDNVKYSKIGAGRRSWKKWRHLLCKAMPWHRKPCRSVTF